MRINIFTLPEIDLVLRVRFPAGEREVRKDTVLSFPAASVAALSPGSRQRRNELLSPYVSLSRGSLTTAH